MEEGLESVLLALRAEGSLRSSGIFTIDVMQARSKTARALLPGGLYLACLVQAGVAAGCRSMALSLRNGVEIVYREPRRDGFRLETILVFNGVTH